MGNQIRIGIFGSCTTREVFTTFYNDYKNHFNLIFSHERESFISLFDKPIEFDYNELKLLPDTKKNQFRFNNMINDLTKSFFDDLKKGIDYLIIDVYFEVLYGILILEDGTFITNNKWDLPKTEFYKNLSNFRQCDIYKHPDEYFELWVRACKKFFDYLKEFYPNVKIILNKIKLADKVFKEDYSFYINEDFKWMVDAYSPFINKLENHIEENYDVIPIEYDDDVFTSELNRWSPYVVHFTEDYYKFVYFELCKIVKVDESHLKSVHLEYVLAKLDIYKNMIQKEKDMLLNRDEEIADLKSLIDKNDQIIKANTIEIKELKKFKHEVLSSSSWKITKPLRNSKKIFSNFEDKK